MTRDEFSELTGPEVFNCDWAVSCENGTELGACRAEAVHLKSVYNDGSVWLVCTDYKRRKK